MKAGHKGLQPSAIRPARADGTPATWLPSGNLKWGVTVMSNPVKSVGLDFYSKCVLTVIGFLLGVIALQPITRPVVASAQSNVGQYYIEPGTNSLRAPDGSAQLQGKVVVDLKTGKIWGFPTLSTAPYPVDPTRSEPPVSSPMYLGRFDFSKMTPQ